MPATRSTLITETLSLPKIVPVQSEFIFQTTLIESGTGTESARPDKLEYQSRLNFDPVVFENCLEDALNEFRNFYINVARGNLNRFLYNNPLDYKASRLPIEHSSTTSSGAYVRVDRQDTISGDFIYTLDKFYTFTQARSYKTIRYIDATTLRVWLDDVEIFDAILLPNGEIQVPGSVANSVVEAEFEFFLPYTFDGEVSIQRPNAARFVVSGISLLEYIETNRTNLAAVDFTNPSDNDGILDFGFQPTYSETLVVENFRKTLDNGRQITESRYLENKSVAELDGTLMRHSEMETLKCMFLACKGRLLEFELQGRRARFDSDTLTLSTVLEGIDC